MDYVRTTRAVLFALSLALLGSAPGPAWGELINNGIGGDGRWEVDALDGGQTETGNLDPVGPIGLEDIIFQYLHWVDVSSGGIPLGDTTVTMPATLTGPNTVTSAGNFAGANGTINWTAVSTIPPGSQLYLTTLTFQSNAPFGPVRLSQYLDEDVLGSGDDHLVVIGTPGMDDFQLLTVDSTENVGVSHAAGYSSAVGMTYIGWAADEFFDLGAAILDGSAMYSIAGVVDTTDLPPIMDPRFPGLPAFGPNDITSAIAFDLNPNATFASVLLSLGGAPEGTPPPPPLPDQGVIPEPGSLTLLGLGACGLLGAHWYRRRQVA